MKAPNNVELNNKPSALGQSFDPSILELTAGLSKVSVQPGLQSKLEAGLSCIRTIVGVLFGCVCF